MPDENPLQDLPRIALQLEIERAARLRTETLVDKHELMLMGDDKNEGIRSDLKALKLAVDSQAELLKERGKTTLSIQLMVIAIILTKIGEWIFNSVKH